METFEVAILELGVTELYLNQRKLESVKAQAQQEDFSGFAPLPVFDFGDGKPVLTDGHHRAFAAWQMGRPTLTVYWDKDTNTVSKVGQRLYRMALDWCRKAGIESVSQLQGRILQPASFEFFWLERCRRGNNLLTARNKAALDKARTYAPEDYTLYGCEKNLSAFFYEDPQGKLFKYYGGELRQERGDAN